MDTACNDRVSELICPIKYYSCWIIIHGCMYTVVWYVSLVNKMFAIKIRQRCEYSKQFVLLSLAHVTKWRSKNVTFDTVYRLSYKNYNTKYFGCYNIYISHIQQSGYNRYFFTGVYNKFVIGLWIRPPHVVPFLRDTPIYVMLQKTGLLINHVTQGSYKFSVLEPGGFPLLQVSGDPCSCVMCMNIASVILSCVISWL